MHDYCLALKSLGNYGMGWVMFTPIHVHDVSPANCWFRDTRFSANELCTLLEELMSDIEDDVCLKLLCK